LRTPWFFGGIGVAILLAAPSIVWQWGHGFPMLELLRNGAAGKNVVLSPIEFLVRQLWLNNPVLSLVWIAGLVYVFRNRVHRWLGVTYVVLITMMIVLHAKDYYPAAVYVALFAAGGVAIESLSAGHRVLRASIVATSILAGLILLPPSLPVLSEQHYIAYAQALRLQPPPEENKAMGQLPQEYADMHGWPELAAAVARVYDSLPPNDRSRAAIYTSNYGEAAAVDFFGTQYGLPPALSGHNEYYLWGPRGFDGSIVIRVGGDAAVLKRLFADARVVSEFHNPFGMPYEDDLPIYVCRRIATPLPVLWPAVKHYD
ncbi:MAG TPA: hypothetical protein VID19_03495, partial [Candidatus Eremiobacteraceae bacterium]